MSTKNTTTNAAENENDRLDAIQANLPTEPYSIRSFIGKTVFIRTITQYYTGLVKDVTPDNWMVLKGTAWIAVTGRFSNMLVDGSLSEVEPYPADMPVFVQIPFIVDICPWNNKLPREQK